MANAKNSAKKATKKATKKASAKKPERKEPSEAVRHLVLAEAGYKCGSPTCRAQLVLELHHIVWVKDGGPTTVENLLALCGHCHNLHTMGHISAKSIAMWKAVLQSLNNPNRLSADLLLFLYKDQVEHEAIAKSEADDLGPKKTHGEMTEEEKAEFEKQYERKVPFVFSGDSLPMLAGLLNSGLIEITKKTGNAGYFGGGSPYFRVGVTEKGKLLMRNWLADASEESV